MQKENIKKIEESSSPYLNIKSSSVGLVPLFKRNLDNPAKPPEVGPKVTTAKITTLKISPSKTAGAVRKAKSDLGEKVRIFIIKEKRTILNIWLFILFYSTQYLRNHEWDCRQRLALVPKHLQ